MTEDGKDPGPTHLSKVATENIQEQLEADRAKEMRRKYEADFGFGKIHRVETMRGEFIDIQTVGGQ